MNLRSPDQLPVLYAEDDENDVFLVRRAFRQAEADCPLHVVIDGQRAIDYLSGTGEYADRELHPMPGLFLLDLNMPRKSGLEVLQWIRSTPAVQALPVIVLTSSNQESDIERAYSLGANSYVVKAGRPDQLRDLMSALTTYWLHWNESPRL